MSTKPEKEQSPAQIARAEKQRVARIEGAKAMADVDKDSVAVRANMERLRALRLAREAEAARNPPPPVAPTRAKPKSQTKAQKLAEYLTEQRKSGRQN